MASARDPLRVPAQFWQRDDVAVALEQRDIGRLFHLLRQYCGASQTRIGTAVGMTQGTVSRIVSRAKPVITIAVLERIADGLAMPDEARMRLGLAPKEVGSVRRRTALGLGMAAALSPATLATVLRESAAEALEFTRERAVSGVGKGTLEHLTAMISELDRAYPWRPATELFPVARAYRPRVAQLINGRHTLREARELYAHAAHLSYLLSDLANDLGSHVTAEAFAIDCFRHADQAGHDELCAWACSSLACWAMNSGRDGLSRTAAERGISRAPASSPIAARLYARVANGHARQGNHSAAAEALADARSLCERLPDESSSRLSTESSALTQLKISQIAASCQVQLGNYQQGAQLAREALAVATWDPGLAGGTHLDLGIALAKLGTPDEAAEHGNHALAQPKCAGSLLRRARDLDEVLMGTYSGEPGVQEFHDRYQQLASRALTASRT